MVVLQMGEYHVGDTEDPSSPLSAGPPAGRSVDSQGPLADEEMGFPMDSGESLGEVSSAAQNHRMPQRPPAHLPVPSPLSKASR